LFPVYPDYRFTHSSFLIFKGMFMLRNLIMSGLLLTACAGCQQDKLEYIAHRGASFTAPENTLAAVDLAWQIGADAVEVDIHLTKDNKIVIIHDNTTERTTDANLEVKETDSTQLRALDAGSWRSPEYAGEKIPFLSDVLASLPAGRRLFIEVKCGREVIPFLKDVIAVTGKSSQLVIICFDLETISQCKAQIPDVPCYWLVGTRKNDSGDGVLPHDLSLVKIASDKGLDGLDVHFEGVTKDFVTETRSYGQKLYVWTVNDVPEAMRLEALGVSGITTDRPGHLKSELKR